MTHNATPAQVATRQGMTTVLWRECRDCGQSKPETREHWRSWGKNGRPNTRQCIPCKNAMNRKYQHENKEADAERSRNYYQANKEAIAEYQHKYREANPEKIRVRQRKYRQANPEKIAEGQRRCYQANPEKVAETKRKYTEANAEAIAKWRRQYNKDNAERIVKRLRKYNQKETRARHRRDWELLPVDARAAALREILATGRWHALRVQLPHVVYLFTWPDNQYVGETRDVRFELRVSEHRTGNGGAGNPDVYAAFAECEPRIQIIHHCENRDDALALEAMEIADRRATGVTLFNKTPDAMENA